MAREAPVRLYWFATKPNFGDLLSPLLVARLSGRQVVHAKRGKEGLRAVGSILDDVFKTPPARPDRWLYQAKARLRRPLAIWGSGFLHLHKPSAMDVPLRRLRVSAVRGEGTRGFLRHLLGERRCDWGALPLGDPGLLAKELLPEPVPKRYDLGFLAHYIDAPIGGYVAERLRRAYGDALCVIDPADEPLRVLAQIAQCRALLSSAMHGCIVADGLGIPNRACCFSYLGQDTREDYAFKFQDYYSALGEAFAPWTLADLLDAPDLPGRVARAYAVSPDAVEAARHALRRALPLSLNAP